MSEQETVKVELAYPMRIGDKDYAPDTVVELPLGEDREGGPTARELVRTGRARWPKPAGEPTPDPRLDQPGTEPASKTSRRASAEKG
ncbi:hypothetical protein AB0I61_17355 [Polymorphospora rubra]|uniref:hypothetical protein n=1 Tax=Polymorphospora rubra TaxID=338584 RepID=UPI0033F6B952